MKIAIVTYSLMMGGIETVIFNQAKYFIKIGHEVTVFETLRQGSWRNYFNQNEIKVVSILPNPFLSKKNHAKKIAQELRKYDAILLHDAPYAQSALGLLPAKAVIIPVLHSCPESMINNAIGNIDQWDKLVYVSPYLKELLLKTQKIQYECITNIPNGIEIPTDRSRIELKLENGRKFIFLGRLEQAEKAVLYIPDIIKRVLLKAVVEEVNIYGEGSSQDALKKRINQLSLGEIIKLHGPIKHENVYPILKQHDYLLMPSFFEGHPIVLLEAMACRTIPFVSDLKGSTNFVIEHGVNGFLCNAADIEDFSYKIVEALSRTDLSEIANRARATIIQRFSIDAMGDQYINLISNEFNNRQKIIRTNKLCLELLGDLPSIPVFMIRPVRKLLRILRLWKERDIKS